MLIPADSYFLRIQIDLWSKKKEGKNLINQMPLSTLSREKIFGLVLYPIENEINQQKDSVEAMWTFF